MSDLELYECREAARYKPGQIRIDLEELEEERRRDEQDRAASEVMRRVDSRDRVEKPRPVLGDYSRRVLLSMIKDVRSSLNSTVGSVPKTNQPVRNGIANAFDALQILEDQMRRWELLA